MLDHAVDAQKRGLKVYESLQNLNEVIGAEYGDRVLHELIQNAHDAHGPHDEGRIAIRLVVQSETEGVLYVANGGNGFRKEDAEAIWNLATSAKEVGEGIGNKGLGFRSIEALTDDVRIFSHRGREKAERFDGYCFRFAEVGEVENILKANGVEATISKEVARNVPRYLVPRPLEEQPDEVVSYARRGYATVVVMRLHTAETIKLATRQVKALGSLDVPLLSFLDRIAEIRIDAEMPNERPYRRRLHRRQTAMGDVPGLAGCRMYKVEVGKGRRFLMVRRDIDKERVLKAVEHSIPRAPQLKRWRNWKGQPVVSVAVGLSKSTVTKGRLYNFLPMGRGAVAPLIGYLDAPFFTDINRRDADLDLPLNRTLMEAAAEACAATALSIVGHNMRIPQRAVFDLVAWTGHEAGKLDAALEKAGSSLCEAPIVPAITAEKKNSWASLSDAYIWPEGAYSILKPREVAKRVGARLVSSGLDDNRLDRLNELALRADRYRSLSPSGYHLAAWSEDFARSLVDRKAAPSTWSHFYEDLYRVFEAAGADLKALIGKKILYDRSGKLWPAGRHDGASRGGVFVRSEASKGKRAKGGAPLPPPTLARRYRFLDGKIKLTRETLDAFITADLIREYDPVEALAGLKSALGEKAIENRRKEALIWAFQVWRTAGVRIEGVLRRADLHVPTLTSWQPATRATFSSSWTRVGRMLENFLMEAAVVSPDCWRARDLLLIGFSDWPVAAGETQEEWKRFLEIIGVADGLRPVAAGRVPDSGQPAYIWDDLFRKGREEEGLDAAWCAEARYISFNHPYTDYQRKEEAWRLPGQIEHERLSEQAKEAFCALAFEHLKAHGTKFFKFEIGRFERHYSREWARKTLPTPLATFLRSKAWIAVNTQGMPDFRKASECWAARTKRGRPPRFIEHVSDTVADFVEDKELENLAFGEIGIRDWQSPSTAMARLKDLAAVSSELVSNNRPTFRREHQRAWHDVVDTDVSLLRNLNLAVYRHSQFEELSGDAEKPPNVIVTQNAQQGGARVLSSDGKAVLEIGDVPTEKVTELLAATGMFLPRRLDGIGVGPLVDGEPFVPRASDPLLTSFELSWLSEVAVLGHKLRGGRLERGIQSATVDRQVRKIKVRRCQEIKLVVGEEEVSPAEHMPLYAFEHEAFPTLILSDALPLNWRTLAESLSKPISGLIDSQLCSLEPLLLRLALYQTPDRLDAPSNEALAKALEYDVQTVQDHRAERRADLEHLIHLLMPVVAYFKGTELARQLRDESERTRIKFDIAHWLETHFVDTEPAPENLIDACERASDRATLRRDLDLDYEKFNRVLQALDEPPLSNESELRRLYDTYLVQMRSAIIERLRRRHTADFHNGLDLTTYVDRKTLKFLPFDPEWVLTRETLEMEVVEAHVSKLLAETLGEDPAVELQPWDRLIARNRKSVREFATQATPIVKVWCRNNDVSPPEPWQHGEPQTVSRHLENCGLLDFELVSLEQVPDLCQRAKCWPEGMPEILDSKTLGLDESEVEKENKRLEQEQQQKQIERRSITFAGRSLDTGDPSFAEKFQQLAEDRISDDAWFERSRRRIRLVEFAAADQSGGDGPGGGRNGRTRRRKPRLTDTQREAMGLASEWLAFQFLRRRHSEFVDEACWVSENRARFCGGDEGNDAAGFDFRVKTTQAEWFYEVKSSLENSGEFELSANELRVASNAWKDGRRRYRILYVPFVFSPDKWCVLELPNPMGESTRNRFREVGRGSVRFRFERR